jgi:excisionase family DNA binding protein
LNLRPPGPEGAQDESHSISAAGFGSQPVETIQKQQAPSLDPVAENASLETPFGAPVVQELSPDPGPHERLMTVRGVADRLGVCPALVYRLCRRGELASLRIGGSLRFQLEAVDGYLAGLVAAHGNDRPTSPPGGEGVDATEDG